MSEIVGFSKEGNIGVITVNNPPVNALSQAVRAGIKAGIEKGNADKDVAAMIIICEAGRSSRARISGSSANRRWNPIYRMFASLLKIPRSRLSRRFTAPHWAGDWRFRFPAISALPWLPQKSACRK